MAGATHERLRADEHDGECDHEHDARPIREALPDVSDARVEREQPLGVRHLHRRVARHVICDKQGNVGEFCDVV